MPPDVDSARTGPDAGLRCRPAAARGRAGRGDRARRAGSACPSAGAAGVGDWRAGAAGFRHDAAAAAQRVGLEGDWLDRFARLLGSQGRSARRVLSSAARAPGDPERVLEPRAGAGQRDLPAARRGAGLDALSGAGFPRLRRLGRQARLDRAAGHQPGDRAPCRTRCLAAIAPASMDRLR